jgi:PAS domain S-box-containing protein
MNPASESAPDHTTAYDDGGPAETAVPKSSGPRYSLSNLHAAGGIGEIWLARDRDLDRDVALKKLRTQRAPSEMAKARFLREARITGQLDHPGVVPVYEICQDEVTGLPYYTMRFLRGRTLTEAARDYHNERREHGPQLKLLLGLLNAFDIVCNTVAYAHSKGIIHRDLKCANVILGDYGEVVVIDWGLAKQYGRSEVAVEAVDLDAIRPAETMAGHILGTPAYMAPEQAAGESDAIGPATDVYGLSAILYEILCGQPPFTGTSTIEVLKQVKSSIPVRPSEVVPGIPAALEQICLTGLAKLPSERHASAEQLSKAVRSWVSELAERRQAQEERERFFALSQDLLAIVDADGKLGQLSPAWTTLLGWECDTLLGRPFLDRIHGDHRTVAARNLEVTQAQQKAATFEAKAVHSDGTTRWVSWNVTPIARERSLYIVGRDITELKRSQQLFEGVLQSAPDALVLINSQGQITLANHQAENIFGYTQDELLGQPIELLVPHRFREKHPLNVAGFFISSGFRPMGSGLALRGLRKDGSEFAAEISLSAIAIESKKLVAASVRDMSGREKQ